MAAVNQATVFSRIDRAASNSTTAHFDLVLLQHVAMNISDRTRLYREIRRVLKPDGKLATFDGVLNDEAEPHYPVPWARTLATGFLLTAASTRAAIERRSPHLVWQGDMSLPGPGSRSRVPRDEISWKELGIFACGFRGRVHEDRNTWRTTDGRRRCSR